MKKSDKYKISKYFFKFLGILVLFTGVGLIAIYGLVSYTNSDSFFNQKKIIPQANNKSINEPTINDVVTGDISSANQNIITNNGSYILPTLSNTNTPGLIKTNSFVSVLYGINFSSYNGYHVRQIIQNYNNVNQYFVLLVNDNALVQVSFTGTPVSNINFTITNPGHLLVIQDNNFSLNITADYQLDAPILDQSMIAYYAGMYFQPPLTPDQTIAKPIGPTLSLRQGTTLPQVTPDNLDITFYGRDRWYKFQQGIVGSKTGLRRIDGTWNSYSKNVATLLYLNSLNNMVFISNKNNNESAGSDAIYIFGGNKYINLWFYTFFVNQNTTSSLTPFIEQATAYANYRFSWSDPQWQDSSTSYSSDLVTQKAYNWELDNYNQDFINRSKNLNKYPNASFIGYYVAGAKYVKQPNSQIQLSLTIPNYSLISENQLVIGTSNVFFNVGNKYIQSPGITTLNLYASISTAKAIETVGYRNEQINSYLSDGKNWSTSNTWIPRYSNPGYNLINVLSTSNGKSSFDVTDSANDGYKAKYYNKLLEYLPEEIGNKNVSLVYERGDLSVIIRSANPIDNTTINQTTLSFPLVLQNLQTIMDDLANIWFSGNTWFLVYKTKTDSKSLIYSFEYNSESNEVFFNKTNLSLEGDLDIISILPLDGNFINVLVKNKSTNKVSSLVYKSTDNLGDYSEYLPYKNLLLSNKITNQGVLMYSTNGIQNSDQKAIWGTVTFKNKIPSEDWDLLNSSAANDSENNQDFYRSLVEYTPGWSGQNIKVSAQKMRDNSLVLSVSIQYFDGFYYSPQQLLGPDQFLKFNVLSKSYNSFGVLQNNPSSPSDLLDSNSSSWISAIEIAIPIILASILVCVGLAFGIPYANTRNIRSKKVSKKNNKK